MKEAKQVIINGTKGEGYAEIIYRDNNSKECKGKASFKEARAIKELYWNTRKKEAEYTGIVYDQGKESPDETFTVIIEDLKEDSSGNIKVVFYAKSIPMLTDN